MVFHSSDASVAQYFYDVFGGVSYWFTSALVVSQLILLTLMLTRIKNIWFYFAASVGLFVIALIVRNFDMTPFPWYYKSGMAATLFMTLGGLYGKYEDVVDKVIGKIGLLLMGIVYVAIMLFVAKTYDLRCGMLSVNVNAAGFAVSLLGIALIVGISKFLPDNNFLNYIGRHSIVFYFFSGVYPAAFGAVAQRIFEAPAYWIVLLVWLMAFICGAATTWFIDRYLPFLLDLRKLKKA